jgi:hypothetical protein
MRHEDANSVLSWIARRSARQAIMNGENPAFLLRGHTGAAHEIMLDAIVTEMRDAVTRAAENAAFYRKMNAELAVGQ